MQPPVQMSTEVHVYKSAQVKVVPEGCCGRYFAIKVETVKMIGG